MCLFQKETRMQENPGWAKIGWGCWKVPRDPGGFLFMTIAVQPWTSLFPAFDSNWPFPKIEVGPHCVVHSFSPVASSYCEIARNFEQTYVVSLWSNVSKMSTVPGRAASGNMGDFINVGEHAGSLCSLRWWGPINHDLELLILTPHGSVRKDILLKVKYSKMQDAHPWQYSHDLGGVHRRSRASWLSLNMHHPLHAILEIPVLSWAGGILNQTWISHPIRCS